MIGSESSHFGADFSSILFVLEKVHDIFLCRSLASMSVLTDGSGFLILVLIGSPLAFESISDLRIIRSETKRRMVLLSKLIYFRSKLQEMLVV